MSQSDRPDQERRGSARVDELVAYTQHQLVEEPTFLGEEYICTELPTHITPARTKEQQVLIAQAYEGWAREV